MDLQHQERVEVRASHWQASFLPGSKKGQGHGWPSKVRGLRRGGASREWSKWRKRKSEKKKGRISELEEKLKFWPETYRSANCEELSANYEEQTAWEKKKKKKKTFLKRENNGKGHRQEKRKCLSPTLACDRRTKTPAGDGRGEAQNLARAHLRVDEGRGAHGPGCQHPLAGVDLTRAVGGVARTLGEGGAVKRLSGVLRKRKKKYIVEGKQEDWIWMNIICE